MKRSIEALCLRLIPRAWRQRFGWKLLRATSGEYRAYTDLFVKPYSGWVDWQSGLDNNVHTLYGLARALSPEVVVEIGSSRGLSTCAMSLACRQNGHGKVYAIDPHTFNDWTDRGTQGQTLPFLRERLALYELNDWCEVIQAESQAAAQNWSRPIDFLLIDGDHTFEGVQRDFECYLPWLRKNALVAFHDSTWEHAEDPKSYRKVMPKDVGVPQFLDTLKRRGFHSVTIPRPPGLTILYPREGGFEFLPSKTDVAAV